MFGVKVVVTPLWMARPQTHSVWPLELENPPPPKSVAMSEGEVGTVVELSGGASWKRGVNALTSAMQSTLLIPSV